MCEGYRCKNIWKIQINFTRIITGIIDIYLTAGMSIFIGDMFLGDDFEHQILKYNKYTLLVSPDMLLESEIKNLQNKPEHFTLSSVFKQCLMVFLKETRVV